MLRLISAVERGTTVSDVNDFDDRNDRRSGRERRKEPSVWSDPKFIIPLGFQLVLGLVAVITMVTTIRIAVSGLTEKVTELKGQVTALQAIASSISEQKVRMEGLEERLKKVESVVGIQQAAYNYNFTTRLATVESRVGIKPQTNQPKEGD